MRTISLRLALRKSPWIKQIDTAVCEVANVAGNERKSVDLCSCRDQRVQWRARIRHHEVSPDFGDRPIYRMNSVTQELHCFFHPSLEDDCLWLVAAPDQLHAALHLGNRDPAGMKCVPSRRFGPPVHIRISAASFAELGKHVGVDEEAHNFTSRTCFMMGCSRRRSISSNASSNSGPEISGNDRRTSAIEGSLPGSTASRIAVLNFRADISSRRRLAAMSRTSSAS